MLATTILQYSPPALRWSFSSAFMASESSSQNRNRLPGWPEYSLDFPSPPLPSSASVTSLYPYCFLSTFMIILWPLRDHTYCLPGRLVSLSIMILNLVAMSLEWPPSPATNRLAFSARLRASPVNHEPQPPGPVLFRNTPALRIACR